MCLLRICFNTIPTGYSISNRLGLQWTLKTTQYLTCTVPIFVRRGNKHYPLDCLSGICIKRRSPRSTYVHIYVRTYIHTYIHIYIHTYIQIDSATNQMVSHKWFQIWSGVSASQMTEGSQIQVLRTSVVIEAHITLLPRSFTA